MRLRAAALALHDDEGVRDKPDRKADVFADLGSPVSPLRLRPAAATPSSSSSSAGSAKSPALGNAAAAGWRSAGPRAAGWRTARRRACGATRGGVGGGQSEMGGRNGPSFS